jgi:hypothetical protein
MSDDNGGKVPFSHLVMKQFEAIVAKKQEVECIKCLTKFTVHAPIVINNSTPVCTTFLIIPSWSLTERECPNCHTVYMPIVQRAEFAWVSVNKEDNEPSRIVPPNAPIRMTKEQMLALQQKVNKG